MRDAVFEVEPILAVTVTTFDADTAIVANEKLTAPLPAGTTTVFGGTTAELLLVKVTEVPPVPAFPFRVIVPTDVRPPVTEVGDTLKLKIPAGVIVRATDLEALLFPAVIVAVD